MPFLKTLATIDRLVYIVAMTTNHSKGEATRQHLIRVGAQLFHQQGYHNTGLQQILKQAGVPKGSFYFHFKDKEAFALDVIEFFGAYFGETAKQHLLNSQLTAKQKLEGFHLNFRQSFEKMGCQGGCPMGNLSQELADSSPVIATTLKRGFSRMTALFLSLLKQGIEEGEFRGDLDCQSTANFIIDSWEGAVLRMKSERSLEPLDNWYRMINRLIIAD